MQKVKVMQILKKADGALEKAKQLGPERVIELLNKKDLRGRGGAGFHTGKKWEMARNAPGEKKYAVCNSDEGEPGSFKDKFIWNNNPEAAIIGLQTAAFCIGAQEALIYLRGEYRYLKKNIEKAITKIGGVPVKIVVGGGAYVCGEETAILESIEGKRGQVRNKPPYPVTYGLFGMPTAVNNVETLANVPLAVLYDDWDPNLRLFSLSGNVTKPGVYELHMGSKFSDLLDQGKPKNRIKAAFLGCSGGVIPYDPDMRLTPEQVCDMRCRLGSRSFIAADEKHSIVELAANIAKFYEYESCGKCTPCREGNHRIVMILESMLAGKGKREDLDTLQELAEVIEETSSCGLGQTSTQHLKTGLQHFRKEFEALIK
ncbi:SLBB domain-containing protein [Candidatus Woesearchaeota archaeon]|nr:SLBB domain-containing protein [Candidatus Woesearchaeota archaeon]